MTQKIFLVEVKNCKTYVIRTHYLAEHHLQKAILGGQLLGRMRWERLENSRRNGGGCGGQSGRRKRMVHGGSRGGYNLDGDTRRLSLLGSELKSSESGQE